MKKLVVYFFIYISVSIYAQDSLYLVGTITGESYQKRITSISRVGDINGDGYGDFTVSSRTSKTRSDQGIVQLFLGSATLDLTPDVTFHYPCCDTLNNLWKANELGDINGDGYDDFSLSGKFGDFGFSKGKVFLYYGGVKIDTVPVAEFYEPWIQDDFGDVVEKVGDINKDGYDDLIICSSYNWTSARGYAYLLWGGDTIDWDRSITFTSGTLEDFFGTSAANIGDINKDGFEDIAISATDWVGPDDTAKIYFYYGNKEMDNLPDKIITAKDANDELGIVLKNCGDINGDLSIEYLIGSWSRVILYINSDSLLLFNEYPITGTNGDFNNDGLMDFVLLDTDQNDNHNNTSLNIYFGNQIIDTIFNCQILNNWNYGSPDNIFFADVNGDKFDEIFYLLPGFPEYESMVGQVQIYSYKNITDVLEYESELFHSFILSQNYPNPFNPITSIQYAIGSKQTVTLKIYDVLGREVATLVNEEKPAGIYEVEFKSLAGSLQLASGIYYYQLKAGDYIETKKMILLK